ncbi:hypothetical protein B4N89_20685 [Embleya scabrispora]|uniref:Uncharacterized protein n=1 Tax=Embleya scabrispora TaxID=159449 RepID=A0A1T3P258_9ACTN|nr:hypothetical protein [Embleya scabrispora]OPC83032.1 hypothetical protein B4N89_20685 [Embleya scabrispora]
MNATARAARHHTRQAIRTNRARRTATRAVATGLATAADHLTAAGIEPASAKRFAGAFSRGVEPTATTAGRIKLRGRVTKRVTVKLYDLPAFVARALVYRPKDRTAAATFERLAYRLAA